MTDEVKGGGMKYRIYFGGWGWVIIKRWEEGYRRVADGVGG